MLSENKISDLRGSLKMPINRKSALSFFLISNFVIIFPSIGWSEINLNESFIEVPKNIEQIDPKYNNHVFFKTEDETCKRPIWPRIILSYHMLYGNNKNPVSVNPGKMLYINAHGTSPRGARNLNCSNISSFIPESGHTYEVSQLFEGDSCRIVVEDRDTGQTPGSYIVYPVHGRCRS